MQRPLKFRAWHKEKMFEVVGLEWQPTCLSATLKGVKVNFSEENYYDSEQSYELMQYTGLLDKNGKEIYEGDIVKAVVYDEKKDRGEGGNREIYWSKDHSWVCRSPAHKAADDPHLPINFEYQHGLPIAWGGYKYLEVIGNIYSNPELLK